jgi:hypothetical protein
LDELDAADDLIGRTVDLMINGTTFVSCSRPWVPAQRGARLPARFKDVVVTTPLGGWSAKIGADYEDAVGGEAA